MLHGCRDGYYSTSLQLEGIQCFSSRIFQQRRHLPQQGLLRLKGCLLTAALYSKNIIELVKIQIAVELLSNGGASKRLCARCDLRSVFCFPDTPHRMEGACRLQL